VECPGKARAKPFINREFFVLCLLFDLGGTDNDMVYVPR
jgi:hypothetical protein